MTLDDGETVYYIEEGWANSDVRASKKKGKGKKHLPMGFRANGEVRQWQSKKQASKKG